MTTTEGTYRALPEVDDEVLEFVLENEAGALQQFSQALSSIDAALTRVDEEMAGLAQANPHLAQAVSGTVDGLYGALAEQLNSEQAKVLLRLLAFFNAFSLLRLLDMQLRKAAAA